MSRDVFEEVKGAAQVKNKIKGRKSLQTLQLSSDENCIAGKNMVLPDNETVPSKKQQPKVVNKGIATEKENAPNLRRSKRKTAISDLLNYEESPDVPKTSKSVSVKPKSKKTVLKPKKGRSTTLKKNKPEIDSNQKKLNFSPVASVLNKSSDVSETVHPEKSIVGTSPSSEVKITDDSGFDPSNGGFVESPVLSSEVSKTCTVEHPTGTPDKETSILTCVNPPLSYWKELAEQRREALEKALHENELLHDELTVLEAENSQLKQLVKEAENLAQVLRVMIY